MIPPIDHRRGALALLILAALCCCLSGCGSSAGAPPARPVVREPVSVAPARAAAEEPTELEHARAERDRYAALAVSLEARDRQRERDAQRRIAAQQAKYATWIAGLIAFGAIVYTVAAFVWNLPKSIGAIAGGAGASLLLGARLWTWLADQALVAGLVLLGLGLLVGIAMLIRHRLAARIIDEAAHGFEQAQTDAERLAVKAEAFAKAKRLRLLGAVAGIRGKPVKKTLSAKDT